RIVTPSEIHSLDVSADGKSGLVGLQDGRIFVLDLAARKLGKLVNSHASAVDWVAFGPDGKHLFSASTDRTARMWDLATGTERARFRVAGKWARGGAVLPDGARLLTGDDKGLLQLWDLATKQEVKRIQMAGEWMIDSLSLTPDGRQALVAGAGGGRVIDLESGQEGRQFQAEHEEGDQAVLAPGGDRLL